MAASFLASLHYDSDAAQQTADEAVALVRAAGHVRGTAWALGIKAFAAVMDADPHGAIAAAGAVPELPGLDDPLPRAWALNFMALAHQADGQYEQERHTLTRALELSRQAGDPMGVEWALGYGGSAAHALGRHAEALTMLNESLDISTRIGNWWGMARNLAAVALATDNVGLRHRRMRESLQTFGRLGDRAGVAFCLRVVGSWFGEAPSSVHAARVVTAADRIGADVRHVPVLGHLSLAQPEAGIPADRIHHARPVPGHAAVTDPTIEDAVTMGLTALDELDEMAAGSE
jgi:tetratricopeptide (TPR) repeat protein